MLNPLEKERGPRHRNFSKIGICVMISSACIMISPMLSAAVRQCSSCSFDLRSGVPTERRISSFPALRGEDSLRAGAFHFVGTLPSCIHRDGLLFSSNFSHLFVMKLDALSTSFCSSRARYRQRERENHLHCRWFPFRSRFSKTFLEWF